MQTINALANVVQRQHRCTYDGTVEVASAGVPKLMLQFTATDACSDDGRTALKLDGRLVLELFGDVRAFRDGACLLMLEAVPSIEVAVALIPVAVAIEAAVDGYPTCVARDFDRVMFGMIGAGGAHYALSVLSTCEVDEEHNIVYRSFIEHRWVEPHLQEDAHESPR